MTNLLLYIIIGIGLALISYKSNMFHYTKSTGRAIASMWIFLFWPIIFMAISLFVTIVSCAKLLDNFTNFLEETIDRIIS